MTTVDVLGSDDDCCDITGPELRAIGQRGQPLAPGTVKRVHVVKRRATSSWLPTLTCSQMRSTG
jgi:hypothetical protein